MEFQQRGLLHAHILVFMHPESKNPYASQVDKVISVEIADRNEDPIG